MQNDRSRRTSVLAIVAVLVTLTTIVAACGGGDDGGETQAPVGDPTRFTVWAPTTFEPTMKGILKNFQRDHPDIEVDAVYGDALELNDRLLEGEQPDLYLGSANDLQELINDGTLRNDTVDVGADSMKLVVAPGNPKFIGDLSVFAGDPTTKTGLCAQNTACGRAARAFLDDARISAQPDVNEEDARSLLQQITAGSLDATLLWRTQAVRARESGTIEYVALPSTQRHDAIIQLAVLKRGEAADQFIEYVQNSRFTKRVLARAGFAPLEGDPE